MSAPPDRPRRLEDWPERLAALLADARTRPFERGRHDCALFAGEAVLALTGHDPRTPFAGHYRTKRGAARLLKRFAGNLEATAARIFGDALGGAEIDPAFAQRGDIAYVEDDTGDGVDRSALAVCDLSGRWVTAGPGVHGLRVVPANAVRRVWRVG